MHSPFSGERSESLSGEAPLAMPVEGVLNLTNRGGTARRATSPYPHRYCVTDASARAL